MTAASSVGICNIALSHIGENVFLQDLSEPIVAAKVCDFHYADVLVECLEYAEWPWAILQRQLAEITTETRSYDYATANAAGVSLTNFSILASFLDNSQVVITHTDNAAAETLLVDATDYTIDEDHETFTLTSALTSGESIDVVITHSRSGWDYLYALPADCVTPIAILHSGTRDNLIAHNSKNEFAIMLSDSKESYYVCTNVAAGDFDYFEYVSNVTHVLAMSRKFVKAVAWRLAVELALAIKKDKSFSDYCRQRYAAAIDEASAYEMNKGQDSVEPTTPSITARG